VFVIRTLLHRVILVLVAVGACFGLAKALGPWAALAIWSSAAALGCGVGTVLLRTSAVGRVTWKNRVAGYLIPWCGRINRGRLWPIPVVSGAVWVFLGGATILVTSLPHEDPPVGDIWRVRLLAAWVVDGGAFLFLLGGLVQSFPWDSRGARFLLKAAAVVLAIIVGGLLLFVSGHTRTAVLVAGGPPLVLGSIFLSFFGLLLLFGRNARWN
jgi:hypothetical protein